MDNSIVPVITIDGPGGVGKGTQTHILAGRLGWHFLDSGAIYRLLALAAVDAKIELQDAKALAALGTALEITFRSSDQSTLIDLNGQEVSLRIRTEAIGSVASQIAVYPEVRQALLERQRAFAKPPGLVADGRDMGTIVFPNAPLKIYLDATVTVRAARRYAELRGRGIDASLDGLCEDIALRDARDRTRPVAPLVPAKDAVVIDTSNTSIADVAEQIWDLVELRIVRARHGEGAFARKG